MARYIDADEAIRLSKEDKLAWVYDLTDLEEFLVGVPTADVAPKSEVAREIFEELLNKLELISVVAEPRDGFMQGVIKTFNKTSALIAELKKKYTEEKE